MFDILGFFIDKTELFFPIYSAFLWPTTNVTPVSLIIGFTQNYINPHDINRQNTKQHFIISWLVTKKWLLGDDRQRDVYEPLCSFKIRCICNSVKVLMITIPNIQMQHMLVIFLSTCCFSCPFVLTTKSSFNYDTIKFQV